jgi:hypothetical protein
MASMPGYHVSKGPFGYLDGMFDGTAASAPAYTAALNTLTNDTLQNAAVARFGAGDARVQHFTTDWLGSGPGSNHWDQLKPADTLREGLIRAITKANATNPPKPMAFFWVCALDRDFHIYYCDGPHHVTVIIFTPPPLDDHGNPHFTVNLSALSAPTVPPLFVVKKQDWESTSPPDGYPSAFTTLAPSTTSPIVNIIERQIMREP